MRLDHLLSKEKERVKSLIDLLFIQWKFKCILVYGAVAQLARAPALQAGGQEFDSPQLHQIDVIIFKITHLYFIAH